MTTIYLVSTFLLSIISLCQLDNAIAASGIASEADFADIEDLRPERREALNIQERNDLVKILTNNLRTGRQLDDKDFQDYILSISNRLRNNLAKNPALTPESYSNWQRQSKRALNKSQKISLPQLAQLLNSYKTRDLNEDGVKLQNLRFGR